MRTATDVQVPDVHYAYYRSYRNGKRCCCLVPDKYMIIAMAVSFFTFIIGAIYVTTVGLDQKIFFPKRSASVAVPEMWIKRAVTYNTYKSSNSNLKKRSSDDFSNNDYKLVCYYNFPDSTQKSSHFLAPEDIDPNLCTHINVGFGTVSNNTISLTDNQLKTSLVVVNLKESNKDLKVLLSIGGAGNDAGFPEMVRDHENRKMFIGSILTYVKEYKFDGVDLDWEFPGEHLRGDKRQKQHFTQLLYEIRKEIKRQEKHKFLLSVAVAAPAFLVDQSYDVAYMNMYVDYVNVMTYDFHFFTRFTPLTGLNAPLYRLADEEGSYFDTLNINASVVYWNQLGMDRSKIVVGLPTYGHSFRLFNPANNGLKAPAAGYGLLGNDGFVDHSQVCWFITKNAIKPVFVVDAFSPYATKNYEWVSYDDTESLGHKTEYVKNHHFGGVMVLSLNTDDYKGTCAPPADVATQPTNFPLTRRIKQVLFNDQ